MPTDDRLVEDLDGVMVPAATPVARSRDTYVVDAVPLATMLQAFVSNQTLRGRATSRADAIGRLVETTRQHDPTHRGIPLRTVENFLRQDAAGQPKPPRYPTTDLRIADALLTAIGRPDALGRDPGDVLYPQRRTRALNGSGRPRSRHV